MTHERRDKPGIRGKSSESYDEEVLKRLPFWARELLNDLDGRETSSRRSSKKKKEQKSSGDPLSTDYE